MRFAHHLSSHLTPEWRNHYIDYEDLKGRIYKIVGTAPPKTEEEEENLRDLAADVKVDERQEELFFDKIEEQLSKIDTFFRAREADATHRLRELMGEVDVLEALQGNRRTRSLRSTRNKRSSLKLAVSEFYFSLVLLQNFQQLNHTGFRKALKKYDKLIRTGKGKDFFKDKICKAYFWKSTQVSEMLEKAEEVMIEKLEDGNRSKAMKSLRVPPLENRDVRSHWVTLRVGLLLGMVLVSVVVVSVAIALRPAGSWEHVTPTVRGLRVGLILSLWFLAFAVNTFGWRKAGVNNVLIFEFDPRNYLNFVQLFEIGFLLMLCFIVGVYLTVFSHWLGDYPEWVGPVVMLGLILALIVFPAPVYLRSRLWLGKICGRIFMAPFWHVTFADFWIADQMNSLAVVFLDLEYFLCFIVYGLHFTDDESDDPTIGCGSVKYGLRPLLAVLPAWFRFAQCLRRYRDTRQAFPHLVNAGKYSTSFFVVLFSSLASGFRDHDSNFTTQSVTYYFLFFLWVFSAIISTCYTFTWDIKMDWGLFHGKYKLREELIYPRKIYYVLAIIEDLIFRTLWTTNISVGEAGAEWLDGNAVGTVLAMMEVFRRFIWNFFRVENEHLNNCGEFRVVRDISIHPINPTEVVLDDEEGLEPAMRKHLAQQQRRLSSNLIEIHGGKNGVDGPRRRGKRVIAAPNGLFTPLEEGPEDTTTQDHTSESLEELKLPDELVDPEEISEGKGE